MKITYCTKCLMPSTKPYISFDENGVCAACNSSILKQDHLGSIDWGKRAAEFDELIEDAKAKNAPFYDVMVPVSGGKDSITQVHRALKRGLRILAVNVDYGIKTELGHYNLSLIPDMGANLIIYRPEQIVHKQLIKIGFEDYGDPDLLSHTLLHAYPLHVALKFQIPLVLLGENSAFEYGGDSSIAEKNYMTRDWFMKFAANKGVDATAIARKYNLPDNGLKMYDFPDEIESSTETTTVFTSHYFYWDSELHYEIAKSYGFKAPSESREGTYRTYVGIDEKINRIHQYMKVLKFGYGRATDHACEDIRNGRLSRGDAKELVRKYDLEELSDDYLDDFAKYLGYERSDAVAILERYRDLEIWKKDPAGKWYIPGHLEDDT